MRASGRRYLSLATVLLLAASPGVAQPSMDGSGHWEGTIQTPGPELQIVVDLATRGGSLAGAISMPMQNLRGLPLTQVIKSGTAIGFQVKGVTPGDRAFAGTISADGTTISGNFTQSGMAMPFSLTRKGDAQLAPATRSAALKGGIEGTWEADLSVGPATHHVVLRLENLADGSGRATVTNMTDGLEVPATTVTQTDRTVTIDLAVVGANFSGAVNVEGTELMGTFTQGPFTLPLTFKRVAAK